MMSDQSPQPSPAQSEESWAALSSLADGEASPELQERCLALWAEQADARERWRHYQLIGDVLRSRELGSEAAHDAAFLSALRARLAREPVLLRPARPSVVRRLRTWAAPMAATAGVAVVAGVVVLLRSTPGPGEAVPMAAQPSAQAIVAAAPAGPKQVQPVAVTAPVGLPQAQPFNGRLIRDAHLDRYLAAHRQSGGGAALQMPGGMVRSVDTLVLEDR